VATVGVDLLCAVAAFLLERHSQQTEIKTFGSAAFWTTTQLLTVSSQIKNPISAGGRHRGSSAGTAGCGDRAAARRRRIVWARCPWTSFEWPTALREPRSSV
jgi:hypothetical protein